MRIRPALSASLIVVVAASGVANAATHKKAKPKPPPPVCNIVTDPSGDSPFDPSLGLGVGVGQDDNADVLSADISSDAKNVTAVIRVKSLASPDTAWPEAHLYMLTWSVPGHDTPVYLAGTVDPNPASAGYGPQFVFGDGGSTAAGALLYYNIDYSATVKGTVDAAKNTVTLSVPIAQLKGYGTYTPGTHFSGINVQTQQLVNGPTFGQNVPGAGGSFGWGWQSDTATALKDYVAGTPSCVKPGS
jgi:hypothetical protein